VNDAPIPRFGNRDHQMRSDDALASARPPDDNHDGLFVAITRAFDQSTHDIEGQPLFIQELPHRRPPQRFRDAVDERLRWAVSTIHELRKQEATPLPPRTLLREVFAQRVRVIASEEWRLAQTTLIAYTT